MVHPGVFAAATPDKPAVVMGGSGQAVTYRELNDGSIRLARWLQARGLQVGDHVALLAENHPRYYEVFWAALRSGLYLTPINRHLSAEEASYLVNDSGATALITTRAMAETAAAMDIAGCRHRLMLDGAVGGFVAYEDEVDGLSAAPLASEPRGDVMLYSSGTTGRPKGIKRPLRGSTLDDPIAVGSSGLGRGLAGMDEHSVYLCPAPLYHSAPLLWSAATHELGGTLVIMERFDAEQFLALVERHRVTVTQVVPTMFVRLLKLPEHVRRTYDVSSLTAVVHAAAPCPVEVKRQMIEWLGPIILEYYSSTEGNGMTFIRSEEWLAHPGSVGKAIQGIPHVCDDDGRELPAGEPGLLYFEHEAVPFSYHGDTERVRACTHPAHPEWIALGDMGYLDDEGYLYLTDRKTFMIISGGVNIYPQEIEDALIVHPDVDDCAVFGLPDPEMGEFIQAVVQLAPGVDASEEEREKLRAFLREHVAHYKVPRVIDFRVELPRLPTGKLYKRLLRDEYLATSPR